ncbi:hypothetical protein FHS16_002239 [Paenibacillus endophyticus]|uniref:Uncharacterized protein n=1 Tax=Paenibacillus endophyticus TaxID=1294268 RepID=A0A7W5C6Q3_9BACL|nr:hypothetical protein [Paenibacillus endophyticus]MBB3152193.1 hypothetical protein [Paenibacillus endophyticus]
MVWMNIDKPTRKIVIHQENCTYVPHTETIPAREKDVGRMGRDGGWFKFKSGTDALLELEHAFIYNDFTRKYCYTCDAEGAAAFKKLKETPELQSVYTAYDLEHQNEQAGILFLSEEPSNEDDNDDDYN